MTSAIIGSILPSMSSFSRRATQLARATDTLLRLIHGRSLTDVIRSERAQGRSAEDIARRIWVMTDEVINASGRTVQRWVDEVKEEDGEAA